MKSKCSHEKDLNEPTASQYRCIKCGEWVSDNYFDNKPRQESKEEYSQRIMMEQVKDKPVMDWREEFDNKFMYILGFLIGSEDIIPNIRNFIQETLDKALEKRDSYWKKRLKKIIESNGSLEFGYDFDAIAVEFIEYVRNLKDKK